MSGFEKQPQFSAEDEAKAFDAAREVLEGTPYAFEGSDRTEKPDAEEAQPEKATEQPLPPEVKRVVTEEIEKIKAAVPVEQESPLKAKLRKAVAIAMTSLTLLASAPAFAEAGSRDRGPGDAIKDGITYTIDTIFKTGGKEIKDYQQNKQRQQREAEREAQRQQRAAEQEARRQQRAAEQEARRQQRSAEQAARQETRDQQREEKEYRQKLEKVTDGYNKRLAEINRNYEQKKYGAIGSAEAEQARTGLAEAARKDYAQQMIDIKTIYNQPLTQEEKDFQAAKAEKTDKTEKKTPAPEQEREIVE